MTSVFSEAAAVPALRNAIEHAIMILVICFSRPRICTRGPNVICDDNQGGVNRRSPVDSGQSESQPGFTQKGTVSKPELYTSFIANVCMGQ